MGCRPGLNEASYRLISWGVLGLLIFQIRMITIDAVIPSVMFLARSFYFEHINLRQVFLFLSCLTLFSCWKHFQRQFVLMSLPRPEQVVVDVEAVVRDLIGHKPKFTLCPPLNFKSYSKKKRFALSFKM